MAESLRHALEATPDFRLVGVGETVALAHPIGRSITTPKFILVDLKHPLAVEPSFWVEIHLACAGASLLAVTIFSPDDAALRCALHAGVHSFVFWDNLSPKTLCAALHAAENGERFYPTNEFRTLITQLTRKWLEPFRVGALTMDFMTQCVTMAGQVIELTPTEWAIMNCLARNAGRVVSQAELWRAGWGIDSQHGSAAQLKNTFLRLRKKIEPDPQQPRYLLNIHGRGYYLPRHIAEPGEKN